MAVMRYPDTGPPAIRVRDGGRLYLGCNDDFLEDNSGSFRVTVYYQAAGPAAGRPLAARIRVENPFLRGWAQR